MSLLAAAAVAGPPAVAPAAGDIELSVIMPVYNEETALPDVLDEALAALAGAEFPYEIVLLDDASSDGSLAILESYRRRHSDVVRVLRHERNRGIAAAFQTLYAGARGRYVFANASDGQVRTADCLRMMPLRDRFELIVGRRRRKQYGPRRKLVSAAFNLLALLLFGVVTHDAGSVKLFRRDVLQLPYLSRGPFREAERIIRARRRGYRIGAIPIEHLPRRGGVAAGARPGLVAEAVIDLVRCWWAIVVCRGG
jgi:glycosyltransferase involved in cell wall biosynthesis